MKARFAYAGLIAGALTASAALAESTGADQPAPPQTPQSSQAQPAAPAPKPGDIVTQQAQDEWRASKLIGVDVYGADNKKIGSIKEVMMDHDGSAKSVVIGIGGFLGIGTKDIAVPFSAVQWKTENRQVPAGDAAATNPPGALGGPTGSGSAGSAGDMTGSNSAGGQTAANPAGQNGGGKPAMQTVDSGAVEAHQGYPDKGVLDMTLAQLQAAPDFHFAPDPAQTQQASQGVEQRTQPRSNP